MAVQNSLVKGKGQQRLGLTACGLESWKQCGDYIDWSDLGRSIFDRKKPLAEATQKRIANGIRKYIVDAEMPYIVKDDRAMAFIIQYHGETKNGDSRGQLLTEPIKTIDTSNRYALISMIVSEDAESTKKSIDTFANLFQKAVNKAVKDALKGEPPKTGTGSGKGGYTKEDILKVANRAERQRLIAANMDLFK